jgi:carboxyl-terminal processing protease
VAARRLTLAIAFAVASLVPAIAQTQTPVQTAAQQPTLEALLTPQFRETSGTLFDNVVAVLSRSFADAQFRRKELPALVQEFRTRAAAAITLAEQRQVVHELLSRIPASHLGVLSTYAYRTLMSDLTQTPYPSFGFQAIGAGPQVYAGMVLEGGPAARAGLLLGDRLVTIDGMPFSQSPRLDWRTDDAFVGDERDPSVQYVKAASSDRIDLRVERRPGEFVNVSITAEEYTSFDAAEASVRIFRSGATAVGYLHFWYVHIAGVPELITRALEGRLKDVDALVVDLRGRGGSAGEVSRIVSVVQAYRKRTGRPVVALADRQSRSGKDILLYEFRQIGVRIVGEASAGAVIPASFADVGHDSILMFPATRLPKYSDLLELKPVAPDLLVERPGLFAAGHDPILEAGVAEARRLAARRPLPLSR